ncbi:MAG: hypothetical protein QG635_136, partial [Bacteroidota bacterium]|nr:hypothetical protein [Bacteroidota bacterium]
MKTIILLLTCLLYCSIIAHAQMLSVFDVDTSSFPVMRAKFYAIDSNNKQIRNLSTSDFVLMENHLSRMVTDISCPLPQQQNPLSSVLTIDISGSMNGENLNIAREAAITWIDALPSGNCECAVTSFNNSNNINQDFTSNKIKLKDAVNKLNSTGGTNYDAGLIEPFGGSLIISKT